MLFHIDYENFLLYAIDYFKREELLNFLYIILSAGIIHTHGKLSSDIVLKCSNSLYPPYDIASMRNDNVDDEIIKSKYYNYLKNEEHHILCSLVHRVISEHKNVMLICRNNENYFINILCDFIYDKFKLPSVNLNTLFTKGKININKYDKDKVIKAIDDYKREQRKIIINKAKDNIKSKCTDSFIKTQAIKAIPIKEVKKLLKEFNINISNMSNEQMREALREAYI